MTEAQCKSKTAAVDQVFDLGYILFSHRKEVREAKDFHILIDKWREKMKSGELFEIVSKLPLSDLETLSDICYAERDKRAEKNNMVI